MPHSQPISDRRRFLRIPAITSSMNRLLLHSSVMLLYLVVFVITARGEAPVVFWSAEPVNPGQTALLQGSFPHSENTQITLTSLESGKKVTYSPDGSTTALNFTIPTDWESGIYQCKIETDEGIVEHRLNQPQPWWFQANRGQQATQGSWLAVFGRCLELVENQARLELRQGKKTIALKPKEASLWHLGLKLSDEPALGKWSIFVHNGCGGSDGWEKAGVLEIISDEPVWKRKVFQLADFGAIANDEVDDSDAVESALKAVASNGGGVLRFGRGRFRLSRGFELPPRLLLEGLGKESTHLVWADDETPPEALLKSVEGKLGIRNLSLYAHNYKFGLQVKKRLPEDHTPGDVLIQNVNVRFTPFSVRLTPEEKTNRQGQKLIRAVFSLFADRVSILECDLAWHSNIGFTVQGNDVLCRGNRCYAQDGGWCPVGGGRRSMVLNNNFTGITTGFTRSSQAWFAFNRVQHQYSGFREGFTTDGTYGGPGFIKQVKFDGLHLRFEPGRPRTDRSGIPAVLRILAGKGAGLVQRIEQFDPDRKGLTLRRALAITPDETSVLWAANEMGQHLCYDNRISDTGIAIQLYGGAYDCVVANNSSQRSGGFRVKGNNTCSNVMFLNNRIAEGHGTIGPETNGGDSLLDVEGPYVEGFKGVTARGFVLRGNDLANDAGIRIRGSVDDVVIEKNRIRNTTRGIFAEMPGRQKGVVVRQNTFENVTVPMDSPKPETWDVED